MTSANLSTRPSDHGGDGIDPRNASLSIEAVNTYGQTGVPHTHLSDSHIESLNYYSTLGVKISKLAQIRRGTEQG